MYNRFKKELLFEFIIFSLGISFIVFFWKNNILTAMLLLILYITANRFLHKKHDIVFYISGGILGPTAEIVCIRYGAWSYANPTYFGIPIWLPLAWGFASVMLVRISETFVKIEKL